ncbi:polysaccharide deacetylase family protein [Roseivirga pacifica]|uniref:polysaccharide deacetylase family protein n=1 Tax=Roseivirga pacifica TaxID=1267423 RepID=UPI00227C0155|nr:polysaccharide deacetylase family protein [Roseivirga pacifica]
MRITLCIVFIISSLSSFAFQNGINTFVYHRFGDDRFPSTNIATAAFEAHLKHLKTEGYKLVTASEAKALLAQEIDSKLAAITIDDGYKSFFKNGLPLLQKYGFTATLYINTETVGSADYMSWEEIKAAEKAGIEIGNHSHSHAYFLNKSNPPEAFETDLEHSIDLFKKHLGHSPKTFAFPYGEWQSEFTAILKSHDIQLAFAQNSGVAGKQSNLLALPRFPMNEHYGDLKDFKSKLSMKPLVASNLKTNTDSSSPEISFQLEANSIQTSQLQCFIQGNECELTQSGNNVTAKGKKALTARRTLFTFTAPDANGNWHWFSYLWIMPEVQ